MHVNSFKLLCCPCIIVYIFDFAYTSTFYFTIILDPFCKQEGELRLRDGLAEPSPTGHVTDILTDALHCSMGIFSLISLTNSLCIFLCRYSSQKTPTDMLLRVLYRERGIINKHVHQLHQTYVNAIVADASLVCHLSSLHATSLRVVHCRIPNLRLLLCLGCLESTHG